MSKIPESKTTKRQKRDVETTWCENGKSCRAIMTLRYDDECENGHNSFSMTVKAWNRPNTTADKFMTTCGANHTLIARRFPEYAKYIKWHLVNSDEPLHYIANTLWHIGDADCDGLKEGEYKAFKKIVMGVGIQEGKDTPLYTSRIVYTNTQNNSNLEKINNKEDEKINEFIKTLKVKSHIVIKFEEWSKSKGKTIDLELARSSAVWEDATAEELGDKDKLIARLPKLMEDFRDDMIELGFEY